MPKGAGANTNAQPVKMRTANRKRAWHREQNANPKKHRSSETIHEHEEHEWDREQTGGFECEFHDGLRLLAERSSAGTAGAGVSVETGWRVKVGESMADRAAPAVVQPRLVRPGFFGGALHGWLAATKSAKLGAEAIAADFVAANQP